MWIFGDVTAPLGRARFQALLLASDLALFAARLSEQIGLFVLAMRQGEFRLSGDLFRVALNGWRRDRVLWSRP